MSAFRISLIFLFSFSIGLAQTKKNRSQTLNPTGFKESDRLLIGKVSLKVTPLREYKMKAGSTGLFELEVPYKSASFKLGDRLGGIDTARLEIDQELMRLSESMLKEKDIPQWHLQRRSQIEQFENQLAKIEGERSLAEQMLANPEKYRELFQSSNRADVNQTEELKTYLKTLSTHEQQVKEMLIFVESERKEELELGELKKKFELRKMQFDMRMQEAYLTVPFDGELDFLFPYVEGEKNYIQAGMDVAILRDLRELNGQVPIMDPDWRLYPKNRLELEVKSPRGNIVGKYSKSTSKEVSGGDELIYSFKFDPQDNLALKNQLRGRTDGTIYLRLIKPAHMVPKFLLVSLNPEIFRRDGWSGLVEDVCSGYELLDVGLYSIAITKMAK
ncbi:MAG: hypothetical protein HN548_03355 [Opitutae bacterium]|nr:hypothetical protein [Opitutae bacterium]